MTATNSGATTIVYRLSRFLSSVAMISAIIAVCVTYFDFPPIGYEGMVFLSSVAIVLAIGAGGLSLVLAVTLILRRRPPKPTQAIVISLLAIALAITYVWTM